MKIRIEIDEIHLAQRMVIINFMALAIISDQGQGRMPSAVSTLFTMLVSIEWNGTWWDGEILDIKEDKYLISYENYSSSWDEWIDPSRLRKI